MVWRVSVDGMSVRRDDANRWLYRYGYALSEVDMIISYKLVENRMSN